MTPVESGYRQCARLTRAHGTTYYWGARLLPRPRREDVFAVYALCRLADDIVDDPGATSDRDRVSDTQKALQEFKSRFESAVETGSADPVLAAIAHTVHRRELSMSLFDKFFAAMAMDLRTTEYETWPDLLGYMEGSAAVIGELMMPVLEPVSEQARDGARSLGLAFQLTNFLRDVGEDLDRGRVYLPQEDLRRFGVDPCTRRADEPWRELMRFEVARNRELYRRADAGIALLRGSSARCVATARVLYAQILDQIEEADYDVFAARARVPAWSKAATAGRGLVFVPRPATPR